MKEFINKYFIITCLLLIVILGITSYIQYININKIKEELYISKSNEKAFIIENNGLKDKNTAFKFTIDQLNYFNDSLNIKMNNLRRELKIKDKDLKQMQYLLSVSKKTDTLILKDTIFIDSTFKLDTLVGDNWYNVKIGLKYPNNIIITPTFTSEKYIVTKSKKETVNPPKKFFISRWFQKKHIVVEVIVVDKNPYIKNKQQRFIEIIE